MEDGWEVAQQALREDGEGREMSRLPGQGLAGQQDRSEALQADNDRMGQAIRLALRHLGTLGPSDFNLYEAIVLLEAAIEPQKGREP